MRSSWIVLLVLAMLAALCVACVDLEDVPTACSSDPAVCISDDATVEDAKRETQVDANDSAHEVAPDTSDAAGARDAGPSDAGDADAADSCVPLTTCPSGRVCATYPNGCGGTIACGACPTGELCNTTSNTCASTCTPITTCPAGACGSIDNGCGTGTVACGGCATGKKCDTTTHTCVCDPLTACPSGKVCGSFADGCGGMIACGTCSAGNACASATNTCYSCATASMAAVPGGTYFHTDPFGSSPDETRTVQAHCMDLTEVTTSAFQACVAAGVCDSSAMVSGATGTCNITVTGRGSHPINCAWWGQAQAYCAWKGKRLPTADEWEWSARSGSSANQYPWGTIDPTRYDSPPWACWSFIDASTSRYDTCAVATYDANTWGIRDLGGNVSEWTSTPDPLGYVFKGGNWGSSSADQLNAGGTYRAGLTSADAKRGFRCVADR